MKKQRYIILLLTFALSYIGTMQPMWNEETSKEWVAFTKNSEEIFFGDPQTKYEEEKAKKYYKNLQMQNRRKKQVTKPTPQPKKTFINTAPPTYPFKSKCICGFTSNNHQKFINYPHNCLKLKSYYNTYHNAHKKLTK